MKDDDNSDMFRQRVLNDIKLTVDVEEWWQRITQVTLWVGEEIFGKTSNKGPPNDKRTWWWNVEVAEVIKEKKLAKKECYKERSN